MAEPLSTPPTDAPAEDGPDPTAEVAAAAGSASIVDWTLGGLRLGIGAALAAAPGWAGRIWVGPGADGPGSKVFARAVGARDVALGIRILRGLAAGEPVQHWISAGFGADLADAAATLIAAPQLTPGRRVAMPALAAAVGIAGLATTRRAA